MGVLKDSAGGGRSPMRVGPPAGHAPGLYPPRLSVSPAINSCALGNGGCQHDCVQLTVTRHRCQCRPEFQLQEDGKRCVRECATLEIALGLGFPPGLPCSPCHTPTGEP